MSFDLTTPRLQLRPCTTADVAALHRLWTAPGVRKYLWDDVVITNEQAAEVVASSLADFATHGFGHWIITRREQSELIGWCGLRQVSEPAGVEVLYGITPECWGQGLAVEATHALLHYGFAELGLSQIYAGTDPPNTASLRVMEKLGMRFDKRTQSNGLEAVYYVIAREEFFAQ
jgi:ribosomal-protein-alanine N-acetyltransferase